MYFPSDRDEPRARVLFPRPTCAVTSVERMLERVTFVILVVSKRALAVAVQNNTIDERCRMLAERLRGRSGFNGDYE